MSGSSKTDYIWLILMILSEDSKIEVCFAARRLHLCELELDFQVRIDSRNRFSNKLRSDKTLTSHTDDIKISVITQKLIDVFGKTCLKTVVKVRITAILWLFCREPLKQFLWVCEPPTQAKASYASKECKSALITILLFVNVLLRREGSRQLPTQVNSGATKPLANRHTANTAIEKVCIHCWSKPSVYACQCNQWFNYETLIRLKM